MTVLAFDTHKAVKELRAAGAAESLAEAVVATVGAAMGENVATKADIADVRTELAEVKAELKADIAAVQTELKADINELRAELKADIAAVQTELKADANQIRAELKADIAAVQTELKADANQIRAELKADRAVAQANLAGLEARLYRHLWIMAASIVGLTVTLIKVFD